VPNGLRRGEAPGGVLEHRLNLLARDAGEPVEELVDGGAGFEILEQRLHRHAGSLEEPDCTDRRGDA
jgi:hypothetical protein